MKPNEPDHQTAPSGTKKTYARPRLTIYGSVTDMTRSVTLTGTGDGGKTGATKMS